MAEKCCVQPAQVEQYFQQYGWTARRIGAQKWQTTFVGDHAIFTVGVSLAPDWLSFAIDLSAYWRPDQSLQDLLLANEQMRLVKFALNAQGRLLMQAELPTEGFSFSHFADCLGALSHYADLFVGETERQKP
jgi:hypothetical protein